jgi:hypothetical protein
MQHKAYALCCADRWLPTEPIFVRSVYIFFILSLFFILFFVSIVMPNKIHPAISYRKGEGIVSSTYANGVQKTETVSTSGVSGTWSVSTETRFKNTNPVSTRIQPAYTISFLNGIPSVNPNSYKSNDLSVATMNNVQLTAISGPNGGMTGIDTMTSGGVTLYYGGKAGVPTGKEWTIDVHVKGPVTYNSKSDWHTLVRGSQSDHQMIFHDSAYNKKVGAYLNNQGGFKEWGFTIEELFGDNSWKRLTIVTKGGKTTIYIDGVYKSESLFASTDFNIFYIGAYNKNTQRFGKMANLKFYDVALTLEDINSEPQCQDTLNWDNRAGETCTKYSNSYCAQGEPSASHSHLFGINFNYPEKNCCSCGKKVSSEIEASFPEVMDPKKIYTGKNYIMHGPFNNSVVENILTMTALPKHSHLFLNTKFYDTRSYSMKLADVCTVKIDDIEYAGSLSNPGFSAGVHAVNIGSKSLPQHFSCREGAATGTCHTFYKGCTTCNANNFNFNNFNTQTYSPWGVEDAKRFCMTWSSHSLFSSAPCAKDIHIRSYRVCSIHLLVPHNKSTVTIKIGPTSQLQRKPNDLWAFTKFEIAGRSITGDSNLFANVVTEYKELYEDTQQWSTEVIGESCILSSCPAIAGRLCAPIVPSFCDGTHFDCLERAKVWCLNLEVSEPHPLCYGISHKRGESFVKLCIPSGNGEIQVDVVANSLYIKRYRSVLQAPPGDFFERPVKGLKTWNGLLNGRRATFSISGSNNDMAPSYAHTVEIPCDSSEVIVRQQQNPQTVTSDCESRDLCLVKVDANCKVQVWFRDRCSSARGLHAWSAFAGPGQTVSSTEICSITVDAKSVDASTSSLSVSKPTLPLHTTAMGWSSNREVESSTRKTICDGNEQVQGKCSTIRGPFTSEFSWKFLNLPQHVGIRVSIRFMRTDYWWWQEKGWIEVDGKTYKKSGMDSKQFPNRGGLYSPLWGSSPNVKYNDLDFTLDHTSTSLEIKAMSNMYDYYYLRGRYPQYYTKQFYVDRVSIRLISKKVIFPSISNRLLGMASARFAYDDVIMKTVSGPLGTVQIMDTRTEGWSSTKTLGNY